MRKVAVASAAVRRTLGVLFLLVALVTAVVAAPRASSSGPSAEDSDGATGRASVAGLKERAGGLLARIRALDIVVRAVREPARKPYRAFTVAVELPVDHADPDGPTFELVLTLLHRDTEAPMVLHTSGYDRNLGTTRDELTRIVRGNQIDMDHRFFLPSRPRRPDWHSQLTIEQAAADEHLVIAAFKEVYSGSWLTTGASKGGMTATYHRHLYPDDVDGTVAYVAPHDEVDAEDSAYHEFLANVGGPALADCRAGLVAVQRAILEDRAWFEERLRQVWGRSSFDAIGGVGPALDVGVVNMYWMFWQYDEPAACETVPGPDARRPVLWRFSGLAFGAAPTDGAARRYLPYYFQTATQIGYPQTYLDPIADLVRHPGADRPENYVPMRLHPLTFDPTAMAEVGEWVRTEATEILFVNGQHDPWSAESFDCGPTDDARDCAVFTVPGGNHGATIRQLPPAERAAAVARVRSWAGLPPASARTVLDPAGEEWIPELDDPWLKWVEGGRRRDILRP